MHPDIEKWTRGWDNTCTWRFRIKTYTNEYVVSAKRFASDMPTIDRQQTRWKTAKCSHLYSDGYTVARGYSEPSVYAQHGVRLELTRFSVVGVVIYQFFVACRLGFRSVSLGFRFQEKMMMISCIEIYVYVLMN